ncbi:MAG TPA: hypothetical protein VF950_12445 [Planctomycetota bacterium]
MRKTWVFLALLSLGASFQQKGNAAIKKMMESTHKGRDNIASEIRNGRGTEEDVKKLLAEYKAIAAQKPAVGDAKAWKGRTDAVIAALADLAAKKPGAVDRVHAATECRACHEAHRPGGNK